MPENQEYTPNTPSINHNKMTHRWSMMDTVMGGTETIRAKGKEYLPKHVGESDLRYKNRLEESILRNITKETLEALAGRPFSESVTISDDTPEQMKMLYANIDQQGNNLDSFLMEWFRSSIGKGFCHVLVEFPRIQPKEDGKPRTLADDRQEGLRPYFVRVEPENLISVDTEVISGFEVISQARIRRKVTEKVGRWGSRNVLEVMVLEPGKVELYRQVDPEDSDSAWALVDAWETGLSFVPLVSFYTEREGDLLCTPPLQDLAYVNIAHWQSSSDQRVILSTARLPILAAAGLSEEESASIEVGPFKFLSTEDPGSKFYYVEHNGRAIEAGSNDLESLENWMSSYGAEFLKKKPGNQTATARALDSAESISKLKAWVLNFEDSCNTAIGYAMAWMTQEREWYGGSVELVSNYDLNALDASGLDTLNKARDRKDISRRAYLDELKRQDIISDSYDSEADEEELRDEISLMLSVGGSDIELDEEPDEEDE